MREYNNYQYAVSDSITDLYYNIIAFLPNILAAAIVLILGGLIGSFLGSVLKRALDSIGIDKLGDQLGLQKLADRTGRHLSISRLVQWVVKWFFILASIIAAADILGLTGVTNFFYQDVLGYAGHVLVAVVIMLLAILAANFLGDVVEATVKAGGFKSAGFLAALTRWSIIIFAVIAALSELQIATSFLQDLFRAVVAMLAVAGGLAFGLGGRDHAKKVLDHIEQATTRR